MSDLISREDAIEVVWKCYQSVYDRNIPQDKRDLAIIDTIQTTLSTLPSADAEQTVIRSRTLMPTKDFKEWAKRIRETNPNAVVIPCDAEVVSAEAEWIPCSERLPNVSGTYLTTTAKGSVCTDHFYNNMTDLGGRHWSYHRRREPIAWMPLPKPYKGGDTE